MNPAPIAPLAHPSLILQTTTAIPLNTLLPRLESNLRSSGVWLESADTLSATAVNLSIELHQQDARCLYTALVGSGLDLAHSAHIALASLCSLHARTSSSPIPLTLEVRLITSHYHSRYPPRLAISA